MDRLKVAFFTEAGSKRGMGHLVRCYTISQEFKKHQHTISFNLVSDIRYDSRFKNINYITWENLTLTETYDIVFIDSYEAEQKVYEAISKHCKVAVYIDDFGRLTYPNGIVVNFAPEAKAYFKTCNNRYLLGLKYLPLRKKLVQTKKQSGNAIFIMLGGSDTGGLTLSVLKALKNNTLKKYVVINKKSDLLKAKKYKNCSILYKPTDDILFDAMGKSSVAITTASMSVYELAYLKIPTIVLSVTENQQAGVAQLLKFKLVDRHIDVLTYNWQCKLAYSIRKVSRVKITKSSIDQNGGKRIYQYAIKVFYGK